MPSVSLGSLGSVISHLDLSRSWKRSFSSGLEPTAMMLLTWTANIMVPVGEVRQYTHHSQSMRVYTHDFVCRRRDE